MMIGRDRDRDAAPSHWMRHGYPVIRLGQRECDRDSVLSVPLTRVQSTITVPVTVTEPHNRSIKTSRTVNLKGGSCAKEPRKLHWPLSS